MTVTVTLPDGAKLELQDGATGGEGVGGGASRARNDQSIRTVTANKIGIDAQLQLNHSCERALMNNGLIEGALGFDDRARELRNAGRLHAAADDPAAGGLVG